MPVHEVAMDLMAPVIFLAIHRHTFPACPVDNGLDIDPGLLLPTHLERVLRGLEVRPAPAAGLQATA